MEQVFLFMSPHLPLSGLVSFPHDPELIKTAKYKLMACRDPCTKPAWTVLGFSTNVSALGVTHPLTQYGELTSRGGGRRA